jgi:hypothetical protein
LEGKLYQIPHPRRNPAAGKNAIKRRRGKYAAPSILPRTRGSFVKKLGRPYFFISSSLRGIETIAL